MLDRENTALVLIDVQDKLFRVMHDKDQLLDKLQRLVRGMQILEVPIILTEQYPRGLGHTVNGLANLIPDITPLEKRVFSCCDDQGFTEMLEESGRTDIVACGIEAHVCVYQTVAQLCEREYTVEVVADGITSRTPYDKEIGLRKMEQLGAGLTTVEMVLFELQRVAKGEKFKQISQVIK
ncbi:MAG: hydrolase [Candidatus Marinimicrobia bacterium]|nr:hydrolase [Candidatus Neomarinimicrobiota bacterium]MCF7829979.1 hydrolase [Candidatus Neomarinimicrobiota bacterium]MCF7881867.1 hydrolase [Candidatus Neomarinimicrobiota bacterium]